MTKPAVGMIGVGLMGHGIAKNIVEAGYPLTVVAHQRRKAVDDLVARGAVEARCVKELAEQSEIIHICVTGSTEVEELVRGSGGILEGLQPNAVIVDCSTSDPVSTLALTTDIEAAGGHMADAPLSRTPKEAWEGTLDAMVGASPETFRRIKPVIERRLRLGACGHDRREVGDVALDGPCPVDSVCRCLGLLDIDVPEACPGPGFGQPVGAGEPDALCAPGNDRGLPREVVDVRHHITAPICQGTNSWSPSPCASDFEVAPLATLRKSS